MKPITRIGIGIILFLIVASIVFASLEDVRNEYNQMAEKIITDKIQNKIEDAKKLLNDKDFTDGMSAQKKQEIQKLVEQKEEGEENQKTEENNKSKTPTEGSNGTNWTLIFILLGVLALIGGAGAFLNNRHKKKEKDENGGAPSTGGASSAAVDRAAELTRYVEEAANETALDAERKEEARREEENKRRRQKLIDLADGKPEAIEGVLRGWLEDSGSSSHTSPNQPNPAETTTKINVETKRDEVPEQPRIDFTYEPANPEERKRIRFSISPNDLKTSTINWNVFPSENVSNPENDSDNRWRDYIFSSKGKYTVTLTVYIFENKHEVTKEITVASDDGLPSGPGNPP